MPNPRFLVSIPAKNEAKTIGAVIQNCSDTIVHAYGVKPTILVISDGSTDETVQTARAAGATIIEHETSRGLGTVFQDAVAYAIDHQCDFMITIDGDGQFKEAEIPKLLTPLLQNQADLASGNRFYANEKIPHMSHAKRIGNIIVAKMVNYILGTHHQDVSCGFRAYSREALLQLNLFGGFTYTQEVFLNLGYKGIKISEVPISVTYFPERKSRIARSIFNYGYQVLKIILSSLIFYRPMRFFGTLTFITWLYALPIMLILTIRYLDTGLISPYRALGISSLIAFAIGTILLSVGVILYSLSKQQMSIDKIYYHVKKR